MTFKIKPIVSERQCIKCMQCKLETEFPTDRNTCKDCRRAYSLDWYRRVGAGRQVGRKRDPSAESPTAWKLPADTRTLDERRLTDAFNGLRYPVTPSPMFGVPMVGA